MRLVVALTLLAALLLFVGRGDAAIIVSGLLLLCAVIVFRMERRR